MKKRIRGKKCLPRQIITVRLPTYSFIPGNGMRPFATVDPDGGLSRPAKGINNAGTVKI